MDAETLASMFHESYERLAPLHGYETKDDSAVTWEQVPSNNKSLMISVCAELLEFTNLTGECKRKHKSSKC